MMDAVSARLASAWYLFQVQNKDGEPFWLPSKKKRLDKLDKTA